MRRKYAQLRVDERCRIELAGCEGVADGDGARAGSAPEHDLSGAPTQSFPGSRLSEGRRILRDGGAAPDDGSAFAAS